MYPVKNFHAKLFQCLKLTTIFSTNGSKCMGKQNMTIHFCHLLKSGFRQVLPCQKISVFEVEYNFLISGTNCTWKKTINFCHLPKRYTVTFQKVSLFETEYAFLNQRNEMYVKEVYQFLSLFKNVSRQELPCQKAWVIEISYTFFN